MQVLKLGKFICEANNKKIEFMEIMNIEIINPKAKTLLQDLAELNLISIKKQSALSEILARLRRNEAELPSLEDITKEVESVRQARYERKVQNNY